MKAFLFLASAALMLISVAAGAQSAGNPDDMFGGPMVEGSSQAAQTAQGASTSPESFLQSKRVDIGGFLFSDYTTFAYWGNTYPSLLDPGSSVSYSFAPNLEADVYLDARPYPYFRVFGKLKAIYPFGGPAQGVYQAQTAPFTSIYVPPSGQSVAIPNISIFELFADVNWNEKLFLRVGQQVIHWGVGYFFSPADILSLTPINPLQPTLERQGPLALNLNVPFAHVDNAYLYVVANQSFTQNVAFDPSELAVAPKVEFLLGDYEIGVGGYYQKDRRPKAMMTATGSLFGTLGIFGEGVLSYGSDRTFVEPTPGVPGALQAYADTTTAYFSGTVGISYGESSQHISVIVQYYYNGQGYPNLLEERGAVGLFTSQQTALAAGTQPTGPILSTTDLLLPGQHYLAGSVSWTDIRASNFDLGIFYEGNLSDGSGVVSPYVADTPIQYCTITIAPFVGYGDIGSEFVTKFGYFALSLKVTVGEGAF